MTLALDERYRWGVKFGRNPDIDAGQTEDVWAGGGDYTGFNATAAQAIEVLSSDVNDTGAVLSTGTADSATDTTLTDLSATFSTDTAAAGDAVVNDTQGFHGIITAVTETELTVYGWVGSNAADAFKWEVGDAYRVVNADDTGAALVRLDQLLDSSYLRCPAEYVVLNGTTPVDTTKTYLRCSRARIVLAGSSGGNEGTITGRQTTATTNVFFVMPAGFNQTVVGVYTVPANKRMVIGRIRTTIVRANGSAGAATVSLLRRPRGEPFQAISVFEVQTGAQTEFNYLGGQSIEPGADVKFRCETASDANTVVEGAFEFKELPI